MLIDSIVDGKTKKIWINPDHVIMAEDTGEDHDESSDCILYLRDNVKVVVKFGTGRRCAFDSLGLLKE